MMLPTTRYKRPESVLVVVHASSEVLLLKRRDMVHFWQSVTGSLEFDELDPVKCALRELGEETGLTDQDGSLTGPLQAEWFTIYPERLRFYPPGVCYNYEHVLCFDLPRIQNIQLSCEHSEYQWVAKAHAIEQCTSITNKKAIQEFVPN